MRIRSIEEINKKIKKGDATVLTADGSIFTSS